MRALLAAQPGLRTAPEGAAEHVLAGLGELDVHPDVGSGLRRLQAAGLRVVTLTNGAAENAQRLLERAGVADAVEAFLSIDSVRRWKPAPEPYRFAAERCGVLPEEMLLAAVHPWDTDGARRAGLRACWIDRAGTDFPDPCPPPELTCSSLEELAVALGG